MNKIWFFYTPKLFFFWGALFFYSLSIPSVAQRKIILKRANNASGATLNNERYDKLVGDVVFEHNTITIYCDSAYFFRSKNELEAYGKVHITEGDSVDITASGLQYDGNNKIAKLRKNVIFTKLKIATLYTDFLDYNRVKNEARYFNGGKLVDTLNVLLSQKGYYDVPVNIASFKTNVVVTNEDNTLKADTLQYNSKKRVIYFRDTTRIQGKDGKKAVYKSGTYDTKQKTAQLQNGEFETPTYRLRGDQNFSDDIKKMYKAKGNVVMLSKAENLTVYGDYGYYDRKKGIAKVFSNAYVAKVDDDKDTLFISADTLVSIEHKEANKKRLLAYHKVKIFKTKLQGLADSLAYLPADSTLFLYKDPILWSEENQLTSDSIRLHLKNKKINKIIMIGSPFVASQDSVGNFNQIKGRKMTAYFDQRNISHVIVEGNGESHYYVLEEKDLIKTDSLNLKIIITVGMNKIICSNMRINFIQGKLNNVSFYVKPDGKLVPIHELKKEESLLKGFHWRKKERPLKTAVVKKRKKS